MESTWIVLGSSDTAPAAYQRAKQEYPNAKVITTNGGILIEPRPDVYVLIDRVACVKFGEQAKAAATLGTHCVTQWREPRRVNGLDIFGEIVDLPNTGGPVRGGYAHTGLSGLVALQYACNQRPDRVVLCGMGGYPRGVWKYWYETELDRQDAEKRKQHYEVTMGTLGPVTQAVVDIWPEVEFLHYGATVYEVKAANWAVVDL